MANISSPRPVLALLAVTSRHDDAFNWAADRVVETMGPLALQSKRFQFVQTDYYTESMGPELMKQFFVPRELIDPARLSPWKIRTNDWEDQYQTTANHQETRPINLDPGYLSEDKLVLASTKNHAHRLYLAGGIYAEITLQYRQKRWQPCLWTYPDYASEPYHSFFNECRQYLRQALRDAG